MPLVTVMYSTLAALPAFDSVGSQIQDYIFTQLIPSGGEEISGYIEQFSEQAKSLTGVGIGILILTAILMLKNIEKVFNGIWRTGKNRTGVASFMLYWAVLSLAPFCIGIAIAISTYITSLPIFFSDMDFIGIGPKLLSMVPTIMGVTACTLIYITVPNCTVPFKHALAGGVFTTLLFSVAKNLFTLLISGGGSSYTFIYGAFAAIPLFLLWLYISWQIILLGAVFANSLSSFQSEAGKRQPLVIEALAILHTLWTYQKGGRGIPEKRLKKINIHGKASHLPDERWRHIHSCFKQHNLIENNANGELFLCRDLDGITLWQLMRWLNPDLHSELIKPSPSTEANTQIDIDWATRAETNLLQHYQIQEDSFDTTIKTLFSEESYE